VRAAEQERPDVAEARTQWKSNQPRLDPASLVFVDETGASTKMARLYGRAKRGRRVVGRVPWGHWKTVTFVAGLRLSGFTAPFVIDCAMNGAIFVEYVQQCLAPSLKLGDIVIIDNLPAHKRDEVRQIIEAAGASLIYLRRTVPTSIRSSIRQAQGTPAQGQGTHRASALRPHRAGARNLPGN
jgi:hypothetical protein